MATPAQVIVEINALTSQLIEIGLCVDSNFPRSEVFPGAKEAMQEISIPKFSDTSAALKNQPYATTYSELRQARAFNMRLIDGALLQFRYRFEGAKLHKHALSFLPSPDLTEYQNDREIYELDILYAEAVAKETVTTPIRFDYDVTSFEELRHPTSHFTIGQYQNCRLPVIGGLTPFRFINFVLRAFYSTAFFDLCANWRASAPDFATTATDLEKAHLHWNYLGKANALV